MEPNTQKLIHSFGALADLGQEVADTGDFIEMVRTSLHLLLGTLAIRRGAVIECPAHLDRTNCLATWGLSEEYGVEFEITSETKEALLNSAKGVFEVNEAGAIPEGVNGEINHGLDQFRTQEIELIIPMVVRGKLTGLGALGGKRVASRLRMMISKWSRRWFDTSALAFTRIACSRKLSNRRKIISDCISTLRAIYRDTVRAFAAAIDIKDKYTQGHSEGVGSTAK